MVPCRYCVHIFTRYLGTVRTSTRYCISTVHISTKYCTHFYQVLISTRYCLYGPTRYRRTRITGFAQFATWRGSICLYGPTRYSGRGCVTLFRSLRFAL